MIKVISKETYESLTQEQKQRVINVSKDSDSFGKRLHPSYLGPINLYRDIWAINFETAIEFCYCPNEFLGKMGLPSEDYIKFAQAGWVGDIKFHLDKDTIWFDGIKYEPIQFRKLVYTKLYQKNVLKKDDYARLERFYHKDTKNVFIFDKDLSDIDISDANYHDVINDPSINFNHAHVLALSLMNLL